MAELEQWFSLDTFWVRSEVEPGRLKDLHFCHYVSQKMCPNKLNHVENDKWNNGMTGRSWLRPLSHSDGRISVSPSGLQFPSVRFKGSKIPPSGTIISWCLIDPGTVMTNLQLTERVTLSWHACWSSPSRSAAPFCGSTVVCEHVCGKEWSRAVFLAQRMRVEPLEAPHIPQDRLTVLPTVV